MRTWFVSQQAAAQLLLLGATIAFFPFATGCAREDLAAKALECEQLNTFNKAKYWGEEVGNDRVLFSRSLGTCLALNMYNDPSSGRYWAMVIDMATDTTPLHYTDMAGGTISNQAGSVTTCSGRAVDYRYLEGGRESIENGCDRTDLMGPMLARIESLGFRL